MAKKRKKTKRTTVPRKKVAKRSGDRETDRLQEASSDLDGVVTIRKYSNRRLYDTAASAHITQDDLYRMVGRGTTVRILDATTGEDITNQMLALALIEHDPGKLRLMPTWLLHQMIRLHEHAIGGWFNALWRPFIGAGTAPIPGWPATGGGWPVGASSIGLGAWPSWGTAGSAAADAGATQSSSSLHGRPEREESLDELRREVAHLLRRLGELEESS